jgi:hypothetical protein
MTDLVPTNAQLPSLEGLRISTPLWRLLSSRLPADGEVDAIRADPLLHREAKTLAPMLKALAGPCGENAVRIALQPMVLVFGVGEAARTAAFWRIYIQQLSDLPAEALAKAVEEYAGLPDSHFFPKPGPLKALAAKYAAPLYQAASRARKAAESEPVTPRRDPTPEEIERVRELARLPLRIVPK